jgi:hypothetical protein
MKLINFELSSACNLARVHRKCPSLLRHIESTVTDRQILEKVEECYELGYSPFIGWHYYCEPCLQLDRICILKDKIRERHPAARFCLWSNGTIEDGRIDDFDRLVFTNYHHLPLRERYPSAIIYENPLLDDRLIPAGNPGPCDRWMAELSFSADGVAHICCGDWRGKIAIGTIGDKLIEIVRKIKEVGKTISDGKNLPETCRYCPLKIPKHTPGLEVAWWE